MEENKDVSHCTVVLPLSRDVIDALLFVNWEMARDTLCSVRSSSSLMLSEVLVLLLDVVGCGTLDIKSQPGTMLLDYGLRTSLAKEVEGQMSIVTQFIRWFGPI